MLGVPFLDKALSTWLRPYSLDDSVDRLNYFVTTMILIFFGMMVSAKQFVGSPIQCWVPKEFSGGWEEYAEDYCFIQNTYYVPFVEEIPKELEGREKAEIGYYQWVPIVLALQAIMFYFPNWLWKTLNKQSGVDLACVVNEAMKLKSMKSGERKVEAVKVAEYLAESIHMRDKRGAKDYRFLFFRFGNALGAYVSVLYLITKAAYLVNLVVQIHLLDKFVGAGNMFWGINMVGDLLNGREWHDSGMFPRVTLCDFGVRKLANVPRYTVQCVLMINMFNEKIYLFLWFWFIGVLGITFINFIHTFCQMILPNARVSICKDLLEGLFPGGKMSPRDEMMIAIFANTGLQPDGILVLRFIQSHAGSIPAKELAVILFKKFIEMHNSRPIVGALQNHPGAVHEHIDNPMKH